MVGYKLRRIFCFPLKNQVIGQRVRSFRYDAMRQQESWEKIGLEVALKKLETKVKRGVVAVHYIQTP